MPFQLNVEIDADHSLDHIINLLTAIMERAVRDGIGTAWTEKVVLKEARCWIHSNEEQEWSFLWVVNELLLSSKFVHRIRRLIPRYSVLPLIRSYSDVEELSLYGLVALAPSHIANGTGTTVLADHPLMHSKRKRS